MNETHHSTDPQSIGIIMDGNRRWATDRNFPSHKGHEAGMEKVEEVLQWIKETDIQHVTLFAFSTENWKRSETEREFLFTLLDTMCKKLQNKDDELPKGVSVRFIGDHRKLPSPLKKEMKKAENATQKNSKGQRTVAIAVSYGGRQEIVNAAQSIIKDNRKVSEKTLSKYLYTTPDPDLIIRTGGEKRISNFLLWQIAYSELFFTDTLWPSFTKREFRKILREFSQRKRNYGK